MTFSIAIPVHNGEKYLAATLASVLDQKRPADEIVAVDDASTDRSAEILQSLNWGGKVRYVFNEHSSGFADAWNRAARNARSEFVTIVHQDDLLDPEYLFHSERALASYPNCRHMYSGYYIIDARGKQIGESPAPHSPVPALFSGKEYAHRYLEGVVRNRHIHRCPGVTTHRTLLLEKCPYRKEAGLIADDDFFLRVGQFTDVVGISAPLASFRHHDESATARIESLAHRLAEDYIFQTKYYGKSPSFLEDSDIDRIQGQAIRFINSYFLESLLKNDPALIEKAAGLRRAFEGQVSGKFGRRSSSPVGLLWSAQGMLTTVPIVSSVLAMILRGLIQLKKKLSSKLK